MVVFGSLGFHSNRSTKFHAIRVIFTHNTLSSRTHTFLFKCHAISLFHQYVLQLLTQFWFIEHMVTYQYQIIYQLCYLEMVSDLKMCNQLIIETEER